eukprot:6214801-Pleurochrysis_carterae.AAC.2
MPLLLEQQLVQLLRRLQPPHLRPILLLHHRPLLEVSLHSAHRKPAQRCYRLLTALSRAVTAVQAQSRIDLLLDRLLGLHIHVERRAQDGSNGGRRGVRQGLDAPAHEPRRVQVRNRGLSGGVALLDHLGCRWWQPRCEHYKQQAKTIKNSLHCVLGQLRGK